MGLANCQVCSTQLDSYNMCNSIIPEHAAQPCYSYHNRPGDSATSSRHSTAQHSKFPSRPLTKVSSMLPPAWLRPPAVLILLLLLVTSRCCCSRPQITTELLQQLCNILGPKHVTRQLGQL